jgi:Cu(I)/Ag(I) efflux system membrane fusion protein
MRFLIVLSLALALAGCSKPAEHAPSVARQSAKYHCPMHPQIVSDRKGSCPICGMDLVPFTEAATAPGIFIPDEARQRMGLTFGSVEKRRLTRDIRTSARIVPDETRLYHVTLKVEGWVEHLHAVTTGSFIQKGEPLLTIYSPMLVSAQEEFLITLRSGNENLIAASRRRLQLWDITDEQIERLQKTGSVEKNLTLYAPANGVVLERNLATGHKAMPGEMLLTLADLTVVWADADIYQGDLPFVQTGMSVELAVSDRIFTGAVSFVSPVLDPQTRTTKARLEIPNPDLLLRPEMWATARLARDLGERLAIPAAAVMRAGERAYAFKAGKADHLLPVEIKLGARSGDWFELVEGLSEGDRVVTSANFLVDSESQLKAALAGMKQQ